VADVAEEENLLVRDRGWCVKRIEIEVRQESPSRSAGTQGIDDRRRRKNQSVRTLARMSRMSLKCTVNAASSSAERRREDQTARESRPGNHTRSLGPGYRWAYRRKPMRIGSPRKEVHHVRQHADDRPRKSAVKEDFANQVAARNQRARRVGQRGVANQFHGRNAAEHVTARTACAPSVVFG